MAAPAAADLANARAFQNFGWNLTFVGSELAVGEKGAGRGNVRLYDDSPSGPQVAAALDPTRPASFYGDGFGSALAASGDTLAIRCDYAPTGSNDNGAGATYLFQRQSY